ncbi:hypothetical protein GF377_09990 [candidate division GN15 bacterium]|nr:hypothetical protein [candidate division GN15 bacterium]
MRLLDFIFAARPLLHLPIWSVYLVALHYHHRLSGESFAWHDLVIMACLSLIFTAASYLNQVYDYESDRLNDKLGFLQKGVISHGQMLGGFVIAGVIPFAVAPIFSIATWFIFGQLLVAAYVYSSPPFRLKDRPFLGLFANAWPHGFLVSMSIMPDLSQHNAGLLGWDNPFYFFCAVAGIYVLTTIPDRDGDAATGKRTIAVIFGRTWSILTALLFMAGAIWIAWNSQHAALVYLAMIATFLCLGALVLRSDAVVRLAAKAPILLLTVLAAYWYPGYAVFVVVLLIATRIYYLRRFGIVYPQIA